MGRATALLFLAPSPGEGSKGQISFNFNEISMIFIPNFVCVLTNKRYKHIKWNFHCSLSHAPGVGLGGAGMSKTLAWGYAIAPHRLRVLVCFLYQIGLN